MAGGGSGGALPVVLFLVCACALQLAAAQWVDPCAGLECYSCLNKKDETFGQQKICQFCLHNRTCHLIGSNYKCPVNGTRGWAEHSGHCSTLTEEQRLTIIIVGCAIGGLVVIVGVAYCYRHRKRELRRQESFRIARREERKKKDLDRDLHNAARAHGYSVAGPSGRGRQASLEMTSVAPAMAMGGTVAAPPQQHEFYPQQQPVQQPQPQLQYVFVDANGNPAPVQPAGNAVFVPIG